MAIIYDEGKILNNLLKLSRYFVREYGMDISYTFHDNSEIDYSNQKVSLVGDAVTITFYAAKQKFSYRTPLELVCSDGFVIDMVKRYGDMCIEYVSGGN